MWILIAFSQEDPFRPTCLFPSSWNLGRTPLGVLCAPRVGWWRWGLGTELIFWEYLVGLRCGDRNYLLATGIKSYTPLGDHSIRGSPGPDWRSGIRDFSEVFDVPCGCHPWDHKGDRIIHNLSARECVFSDGFTFFFFFFTLRIFSLIFFSCLSFHSYEIRTSTVQWKREEFKKI